MKITKSQLRELIEEEVNKIFSESAEAAQRAKERTQKGIYGARLVDQR